MFIYVFFAFLTYYQFRKIKAQLLQYTVSITSHITNNNLMNIIEIYAYYFQSTFNSQQKLRKFIYENKNQENRRTYRNILGIQFFISSNYLIKYNIQKYFKKMKQSYQKFNIQIRITGIQSISNTLQQYGYPPIKVQPVKFQTTYRDEKLKDTPWLKNKQPFENKQNLYLRIVDLMKMFIRFQQKNFLQYAATQSNIAHLLNKIQSYRKQNAQFQLLFYLMKTNSRKLINLYIKLRQQILTRCGHNSTKYMSVALHNQSKNFIAQNVTLDSVKIDYLYWGVLAEMSKSKIAEDMLWWLSKGNRKLSAVQFIKACLWSHETQLIVQNPEK